MHTRQIIGLVISIITAVVLLPGLIDPVEGSVALAAGGVLMVITWAISRIPVPRLEWIPWLVSVGAGAAALAAVFLVREAQGLPVGGAEGLPWWLWAMVAIYEIAVALTIAGSVQYIVRHVKALRHPRPAAVA